MDTALREMFDEHVEAVVRELPGQVRAMLEEVPLIVEDRPTEEVLEFLELETDEGLAGMYVGQMMTRRSVEGPSLVPTRVYLFRYGVLDLVENLQNGGAIREQIRITILHELGHHFGLEEDDLESLGFA